jgi:hypothetical protein
LIKLKAEQLKKPENILTISIFIVILFLSLDPIKNYDIWWHLKTGQIIIQTGEIPNTDIFSYTKIGESWINHEWLSQVIFYLSFSLLGLNGPWVLKIIILLISFLVIFKRNQLFLNGFANLFSIMVIVMISYLSWLSRPIIFSLLLIPLILYLLDLHSKKDKKILWIIPPLMLIWVNLHGSYILGLLLLFLYSVNALFTNRKKGVYLSKVLATSVIVTLINPNTYQILLYPIQYATYTVHSKYIIEWQSPTFHSFTTFEGALLLSIFALGYSKKVELLDLILLLLFTHLGLFAIRNTALYALVAVPIIFKYLEPIIDEKLSLLKIPSKSIKNFTLSFSIAFLIFGTSLFGYTSLTDSHVFSDTPVIQDGRFPENASKFLLNNQEDLSGLNMYNAYSYGGYLIWALYPTYKVFIDGRADVYGDLVEEYQTVKTLGAGAPEILEKYNISLIVIPKGSVLETYLKDNPLWQLIYSDEGSVIYVKVINP